MNPAEQLGFVHRFEPASTPNAPTLVLLHGTGGDENDLIPLGQALDSNAGLLSPLGQVRENGMPRWFRRHAEGVFDTEDLITRTHELADFVTGAVAHYQLDASKLVVVGFSNGANIAAAMTMLRPQVFRGAVLFAPMHPLADPGPVDLSHLGVFIGAGRADPIAVPEQAEALARLLTDHDAAVEMRWHHGGHGVDQTVLTAAATWLGKLTAAMAGNPLP